MNKNERLDPRIAPRALSPKQFAYRILGLAAFILFLSTSHVSMTMVVIAIYSLAETAIGMLQWFNSPRPGETLVWISQNGMGQQGDQDNQPLLRRIRFVLWIGYAVMIVMLMFVMYRNVSIVFYGIMALFTLIMFYFARRWFSARRISGNGPIPPSRHGKNLTSSRLSRRIDRAGFLRACGSSRWSVGSPCASSLKPVKRTHFA